MGTPAAARQALLDLEIKLREVDILLRGGLTCCADILHLYAITQVRVWTVLALPSLVRQPYQGNHAGCRVLYARRGARISYLQRLQTVLVDC